MTKKLSVSLLPHHMPVPPAKSNTWGDWVSWFVMVINPDDAQFGFIASLLHDVVKHGSLGAHQPAASNNVIRRVQVAYYLGEHCLKLRLSPHKAIGFRPWLAVDNTKEGA
ncbi:hypothetical protein E4191_03670 [Paracoccus liaowanqingii]|uniref:Uncharacterized protein n=1 Tax=Paracoccus liaowanqingii TaxID=2560053 RepID=A0A4P7HJY5_9RHOB|nr:hypothetical protein [Paracoccus liaowanqingii]QBX33913.1 hypothetical protein E4191_03670 [Paracoccus liaowanqingii]